jgi:hypothetical protein
VAELNCIQHNVGRISERIVSNELEFRGFRVSDLNKEGTSANADLLAAKDGKTWQIQPRETRCPKNYLSFHYLVHKASAELAFHLRQLIAIGELNDLALA